MNDSKLLGERRSWSWASPRYVTAPPNLSTLLRSRTITSLSRGHLVSRVPFSYVSHVPLDHPSLACLSLRVTIDLIALQVHQPQPPLAAPMLYMVKLILHRHRRTSFVSRLPVSAEVRLRASLYPPAYSDDDSNPPSTIAPATHLRRHASVASVGVSTIVPKHRLLCILIFSREDDRT